MYALRIQQDLLVSGVNADNVDEDIDEQDEEDIVEHPDHENWNLPIEVRCNVVGAGLPSENLLGYKRATRLGPEKIGFLLSNGIRPGVFPSASRAVPFSVELMNAVDTEYRVIEHMKNGPLPSMPTGSLGQLPFVTARRVARTPESRQVLLAHSTFHNLGSAGYIGASFLYRMKHVESHGRKPWAVYLFNNDYINIPAPWTATINTLREDEPDEINEDRFTQKDFLVVERIKEFQTKCVVEKKPP